MRVTLLHNPKAGDDPVPADELVHDLRWAGYDVAYTAVGSGAIALPDDPGEMVVVAAGDGTVRQAAKLLAGSGVPLAILPTGTANNVARSLGQVGARRRIVAGWREGVRAALDLGVVRAPWGEERFIEAFGGGAFARMIADGVGRHDHAGFAGNRLDRGLQMLREALANEPCRRWRLRVDGEEHSQELLFVEVMNVCFLGPGVPFAPAADPTDGAFDLLVAGEEDRAAVVDYVEQRLHGKVPGCPPLVPRRCARVEATPEGCHVHVDDRPWRAIEGQEGEVLVSIDHAALQVVVSPGALNGADAAPPQLAARRNP